MSLEKKLHQRSESKCELCTSEEYLKVYEVPPTSKGNEDDCLLACEICINQIENPDTVDANHWRCLNDSMWSSAAPVQVMAWRMLHRLKSGGWSQDLLDMMYMEEQQLEWAAAAGDAEDKSDALVHRDANGVILQKGDNVVLIKDLRVKGSSMIAKQGTAVRRISLDHENATFIEGKVDGIQIVLITEYVKKL